eukprot:5554495-Amphidinium_carterae.1
MGQLTGRQDQEVIYTGSKFRLMRDGGRLPSMGHRRPALRQPPQLLGLAELWWKILQSSSARPPPTEPNAPPLPLEIVENLREATIQWLGPLGLDSAVASVPTEGQPFFLDLFVALAMLINDPNARFPLQLKHPMPSGVEEHLQPTLGIFRTKLVAEALHPTTTVFMPAHNYPSAGRHEHQLLENHRKYIAEGLMAGSFESLEQVAEFLQCRLDE